MINFHALTDNQRFVFGPVLSTVPVGVLAQVTYFGLQLARPRSVRGRGGSAVCREGVGWGAAWYAPPAQHHGGRKGGAGERK